ncbi:MAG: septum formation initiator family protein [Vicinamibacterales bacterium]
MADTAAPNVDSPGPDRRIRPRRKTDVLPRAQAAARRTRMVQLAIFAVAAVITIDALVGDKGLLQTFRARREQAQVLDAIHRLRADNARKREYARRLLEDPAAIEEAARRNLGLVKPGEVLVIVRDAEKR